MERGDSLTLNNTLSIYFQSNSQLDLIEMVKSTYKWLLLNNAVSTYFCDCLQVDFGISCKIQLQIALKVD